MPKRFKEKLEKLIAFKDLIRTELTRAYIGYEDGSFPFDLPTEEREKAKQESYFIQNLIDKLADGSLEPLPFGYWNVHVLPLDNLEERERKIKF